VITRHIIDLFTKLECTTVTGFLLS